MKKLLILFATLAVTANAQPTNSPPSPSGQSIQAETVGEEQEASPTLKQSRPNEIIAGSVTYSGIAIEVKKTRNPLQLINPAAPLGYGPAEDNVARDFISGRVSGLKLFSIQF